MTEVKIDEVLRLVRDVAAKVASHDAMPCWTLSLIERPLDVLRNVLFDRELGHSLLSDFDCLLRHVLGHVRALDLGFQLLPGSRGSARLDIVGSHCCVGSVEFRRSVGGLVQRCRASDKDEGGNAVYPMQIVLKTMG